MTKDSNQSSPVPRSPATYTSKGLESSSEIVDKNDHAEIYESARRQSDKYFSLDNLYNIDDNINSENSIQKRKLANHTPKNGLIPSRPTIPRRNSAKQDDRGYLQNASQLLDDDDDDAELNHSLGTSYGQGSKKYDTMPNLRTSAKNRKKLEKLFSIGPNDDTAEGILSNSKGDNLYLSKLKAAEKKGDLSSSRYTPSNPESGIFSMSDYDQL